MTFRQHLTFSKVDVEFYIFGSILNKNKIPSDIDLLVIYSNKNEPKKIRNELHLECTFLPIDLIFMTKFEEKELSFIKRTKAIKIE